MPPTSSRDRVSTAQEKVVISRSGSRCAYPKCGLNLVIDPEHPGDQPKATGKVAHIAAASPGGPRYDESMTPAQRGSAANLIYLCGPHHDAVDAQLELHTVDFLLLAKKNHEEAIERAVRVAIGNVTFEELSVVCAVVANAPVGSQQLGIERALPLQDKINLNNLGESSVQRIKDGLSQAARVHDFVAFQNGLQPSFGRQLVSRFKGDYYAAVADGLDADSVFDYLTEKAYEGAGAVGTAELRAASLAVVAYLFEICEIFEHD